MSARNYLIENYGEPLNHKHAKEIEIWAEVMDEYANYKQNQSTVVTGEDQPKPSGTGREIGKLVLADIKARIEKGKETYGEPLKANNGRNAIVDAYEEALDLAIYLRQVIEESEPSSNT